MFVLVPGRCFFCQDVVTKLLAVPLSYAMLCALVRAPVLFRTVLCAEHTQHVTFCALHPLKPSLTCLGFMSWGVLIHLIYLFDLREEVLVGDSPLHESIVDCT